MNREILFKGKRTDNGEWVEGIPIKTHIGVFMCFDKNPHYCSQYGYMEIDDVIKIMPETLCQYTGLTDKNGQKIWENDICRTHYANAKKNKFIETIVFEGGRFCAYQNKHGCKSWAGIYNGTKHLSVDKSVYMDSIEAIGNIFDNRELLEGDDDA